MGKLICLASAGDPWRAFCMQNIIKKIDDYFMELARATGKLMAAAVELFVHLVPLLLIGLCAYLFISFIH